MGLKLQPSHSIHGQRPRWACAICGAPFFEGEQRAYERHCLTKHDEAELHKFSSEALAPGLRDSAGDQDWAKWVREHAAADPGGWARWGKTGDGKNSSGIGDG